MSARGSAAAEEAVHRYTRPGLQRVEPRLPAGNVGVVERAIEAPNKTKHNPFFFCYTPFELRARRTKDFACQLGALHTARSQNE